MSLRGFQRAVNGRRLLPGKPLPPAEIPDYTIRRDTLEEVFSNRFQRRLKALNAIVRTAGEALEGNIFYADRAERFKERMLEVGVNAGHSALLALSSNPKLHYCGVDIMSHAYTKECVDFLKGELPGRVRFFPGDSREVLPRLADAAAELGFDLLCVDGGHTSEVCYSDDANCIRMSKGEKSRHLLLDDVHASWLFDIYCEFVARGDLTAETFFGDWEEAGRNLLARIE